MNRKTELTRRFRAVSWGRLYWNKGRNRLMQHMDSDDVCIVRDGSLTTHYKTIEAFEREIKNAEDYGEQQQRDMADAIAESEQSL